ncbi:hypothetical protein Q428_06200 [Fervidicella metallireducens AeB]|uniref:Peptidase M28 domain-containing protein n=1 Tax=Fervidicella metallireducens AeB TaxID=1403537 RepID=A0A017RVE8_9CLOT|nr:M28 family metallopeptidase [Fervidicella metallireducens]EYE88758.1 hypothetical protein Q428_06200 [Fervidicella metallireducens AeB]
MSFKNRSIKKFIPILLLSFLFFGCYNKSINTSTNEQQIFDILENNISSDRILDNIKELSSKKYDGRFTGSVGNKLASDFIASYFKEIGLKSPDGIDDYKQYYQQSVLNLNSEPILKIIDANGKTLKQYKYLKDFSIIPYRNSRINGTISANGFYINDTDVLNEENRSLTDKIILVPENLRNELLSGYSFQNILSSSTNIKAAIFEYDLNNPKNEVKHFTKNVSLPTPTVYDNEYGLIYTTCIPSVFKEILNYCNSGNSIYLKVDYSLSKVKIPNVIGLIPGNDTEKEKEYIIISAHFDHLGNNKNGTYNPGALDNASGVASLMEIARTIKESKIKPKKSIMFIAFNGEEEGLVGSTYFVSSPLCPPEDSVVINLDMIGHKNDNPLTFYYSRPTKLLKELCNYADLLGIKFINDVGDRSDHAPFESKDIQSVTCIEWETSEYHSYLDTPGKIDKNDAKKVVELILYYISKNAF